jgi:eukaryotic-like serine/threonine-protein kinase
VYREKHHLIGVAPSNLAGVHQDEERYAEAETLFRNVLRRYGETLAPDQQLVRIAHVRLGRTLLGQRRHAEAERGILDGYALLMKQATPRGRWVTVAREDLVTLYDAVQQPDKVAVYRAALSPTK